MNKKRRSKINSIIAELESSHTEVTDLIEEDEICYDKLSEKAQESEKGYSMQANIWKLEDVTDGIEAVLEVLNDL